MKLEITFAILWIPFIIAVFWVFTPPVLITLAVREWWKSTDKGPRTRITPITIALAVFADWACFLMFLLFGFIGGFGTHFMTTRLADWFLYFSLVLLGVTFVGKIARWKLAVASFLVLALWVGSEMVA